MLRFLLLLLVALPLQAADVKVFAAASLTDALQEIARSYERQTGDRVVFNFGGSSILARQIEQGAPADLFLSADEEKMNVLQRRGLIVTPTRVSILSNTLVVVGERIRNVRELANVRRIALAEPSSVPAGIYAKEYLRKAGLWERVAQKIVPTENVRAALAAVESGNVDAAIVYRTDVLLSKRVPVAYEIPRAEGPRISYPFALVKGARPGAGRFLAYLRSPAARAIFVRHGFIAL
ncbi:MAG TPA: molybdate ABC transporter substrate-binding protein [Thermoanaerobaculia bacterium]|jgi:molybdate transport system substrate-binding protein